MVLSLFRKKDIIRKNSLKALTNPVSYATPPKSFDAPHRKDGPMYKLAIPIHIHKNTDPDAILKLLREVGADYAMLAFDDIVLSAEPAKYRETLSGAAHMIPLLREHG